LNLLFQEVIKKKKIFRHITILCNVLARYLHLIFLNRDYNSNMYGITWQF